MAVTFDHDGHEPAIPWAGADVVDSALVRRLRTQVARELADAQAERERSGEARLSGDDEREYGVELINDALEHHALDLITGGLGPPTAEDEEALHRAVFNLLFGLGRLQPHLDREDVVNVHASGDEPVWLDLLDGRTIRGAPVADSDDELVEFVRELGRRVGLSERLFDPAHPRINLQLPEGKCSEVPSQDDDAGLLVGDSLARQVDPTDRAATSGRFRSPVLNCPHGTTRQGRCTEG